MDNQSFQVLNRALEPCPVWVPGDLYIGGEGLARGYWGDEAKTAASFIVHPATGERLYRTGDLGRYLPSGDIEFLGRDDLQVKIKGHRIELGEIETVLGEAPGVAMAVVAVVGEARSAQRLAAFYVPEAGAAVAAEELREIAAARLPSYMVPATFAALESLPLTANGKIDRAALAAQAATLSTGEGESARRAPSTPTEEKLAAASRMRCSISVAARFWPSRCCRGSSRGWEWKSRCAGCSPRRPSPVWRRRSSGPPPSRAAPRRAWWSCRR
jgi:acyl-coenzyme A synthetase/AMP-(fatty) acid ligase